MKLKNTLFISLLFTTAAVAQTDVDALRYSRTSLSGTARFSSMGGAFGALGGDFSSLSVNPAGIAVYRTSEITFTPSVYVGSTTSVFHGKQADERRYNFNFGNGGLVYTRILNKNNETPGWKSWNFGVGYNRMNNFHNKSIYQGTSPNSLLDDFVENAFGQSSDNLDPYFEQLAFNTWLLDTISAGDYFNSTRGGAVLQRRSLESRGSMGETVFTFGANYSNRLYVGATLGFTSLRYSENVVYEESDPENQIDSLNAYEFRQDLTTKGSGINFKVGFIYRASDWMRFGMAVHTPTWYTMNDVYLNSMRSRFDGGQTFHDESPNGAFDYELTTPFRVNGSLAFIYQQSGLLSLEYEFTDVSEARFGAAGFTFANTNDVIRNKYTNVNTFHAGAEWRFGMISVRGGANYSTSPINTQFKVSGSDFSRMSFTGGLGLREATFFADLGYVWSESNEFFQPYTLDNELVEGVKSKVRSHNFLLTFGFKF